jgi:ribosomal protein S18 acetylase RimI-like enzyme
MKSIPHHYSPIGLPNSPEISENTGRMRPAPLSFSKTIVKGMPIAFQRQFFASMTITMPKVTLVEATIKDLPAMHRMQIASFRTLLAKYRDYDSNPGSESYQKVLERFQQPQTKYYAITDGSLRIGAVRVRFDKELALARVSPLFLLPAYRGQGFGSQVMRQLEETYPSAQVWEVETILQEKKLCSFYERLGYRDTGLRRQIRDGLTIIFYKKVIG